MSRFKVLWIDDQKTKCKKDARSVSRIIESLGFEPDIQIVDDISEESLNDKSGELNKAICARDVDLFVIDYNLKNELFGSDVVEEIRKNNDIYTDIVFYSSVADSLISAVKNSFDSESIMNYFDGVYIAPLGDEFIEKIRYVITKIIKSWYNVHSIRGIILSKASKFEQLVSALINANYISCLQDIKEALNKKSENVCHSTKDKWAAVNKSSDPVPQILRDPINFNWAVKKMLLKILDDHKVITVSTWEDIEEIFYLRNIFAHNPIHLRDGVLVLKMETEEKVFSEDDIDQIRAALTRVEDDLCKILSTDVGERMFFEAVEEIEGELCII